MNHDQQIYVNRCPRTQVIASEEESVVHKWVAKPKREVEGYSEEVDH
jgi:hypothetical protein